MNEKILIVDDDPETLRLISLVLQKQGYQTKTTVDGKIALAMVAAERFDLILLDIMMPDMDGYEVTRELRRNPSTETTPILMFSAKNQVEDRVTGFDSGIDDYITKPIHPSELVARIKSMLLRSKKTGSLQLPKGHMIGFLAVKGGLGTSTLVINTAARFQQKYHREVVAAEMLPGHGTWGVDLDLKNTEGLGRLLRLDSSQIERELIEKELVGTNFGVRLLLSSISIKDFELGCAAQQMEKVARLLPTLGKLILLDLGNGSLPGLEKILPLCNEIFLVTDPFPTTLKRAAFMRDELSVRGIGVSRILVANRTRCDIQTSATRVQEILKQDVPFVMPPVPEQAYRAVERSAMLLDAQPESVFNQQISTLVDIISTAVPS